MPCPHTFGILFAPFDQTFRSMRVFTFILALLWASTPLMAQTLYVPDRVFDGEEMHEDWAVLVEGGHIAWAGPLGDAPFVVERRDLDGMTLLPGLIEGHSHILLHPYNETSWNDQVLKESRSERAVRAAVHVGRTSCRRASRRCVTWERREPGMPT